MHPQFSTVQRGSGCDDPLNRKPESLASIASHLFCTVARLLRINGLRIAQPSRRGAAKELFQSFRIVELEVTQARAAATWESRDAQLLLSESLIADSALLLFAMLVVFGLSRGYDLLR